jgi:hypothetical protein
MLLCAAQYVGVYTPRQVCAVCCAVCVLQGERGHAFYIVESGQLSAFKDNATLPVLSYGPGG